MFKMILSTLVVLGLGCVAHAADPAAAPAEGSKMDAPAADAPKMDKKMEKMHKKGHKMKKTTTTEKSAE